MLSVTDNSDQDEGEYCMFKLKNISSSFIEYIIIFAFQRNPDQACLIVFIAWLPMKKRVFFDNVIKALHASLQGCGRVSIKTYSMYLSSINWKGSSGE